MIWLNENNPYAAQWLRNLIAAGHLPNGRVDARSVLDVTAADLAHTQCHFFAGIGGWPYALELAGWPSSREIWTASLPCQPFSVAGQRQGHVDQRHLWPAFHRLVTERRPATIFGEQVASADGREWLAAVRADLEGDGYAVGAACLPACGVGAPHRRYRFFWVAHRLVEGREGRLPGRQNSERRDLDRHLGRDGAAGLLADADSEFIRGGHRPDLGTSSEDQGAENQRQRFWPDDGADGADGLMADADGSIGGQGSPLDRGRNSRGHANERPRLGRHGYTNPWSDLEWLPCRDGKWRPTQSGLQPLAHGISGRVGRLRAYGNAIAPPLAAEFIKAYLDMNSD